MTLPLVLPTLQNWSCHNCGGCCHHHDIEVTPEEKRRIESQQWEASGELPPGQKLFQRIGRLGSRYRLAQRSDGGCVFLNEQGLCRIHAKFGEPAKPLACRLYPYVFHPAGKRIVVGYRFSCPSVVANRGRSATPQDRDLRELERLVVPEGADRIPTPEVNPGQRLAWADFLRIVEALVAVADDRQVPLVRRLLTLDVWARLLGQARFEKIQGARVTELMEVLTQNIPHEVPDDLASIPKLTGIGRLQFRQLVSQYARRDTFAEVRGGWSFRWKLFQAAWRTALGVGSAPALVPELKPVSFRALELPAGPIDPAMDEMATRYLRVKLESLHFCGPAFYDVPLAEGLYSLILAVAVAFRIAKWRMRSEGRGQWIADDLGVGLAITDHQHGFAPVFGQKFSRARTRQMAELGQIAPAIVESLS